MGWDNRTMPEENCENHHYTQTKTGKGKPPHINSHWHVGFAKSTTTDHTVYKFGVIDKGALISL